MQGSRFVRAGLLVFLLATVWLGREGHVVQAGGISAPSAQGTALDVRICYGGAAPAGGVFACGAGSSEVTVPASTVVTQYTLLNEPAGNRIGDCGPHFVRDLFCGRELSVTYTPATWTYATPAGPWGSIYGYADVFCNAPIDDIIGGGPGAFFAGWPNPVAWAPFVTATAPTPPWMNNGDARLVPPSFPILGTEQATLPSVFISGLAIFVIGGGGSRWTVTTAASPYTAGLKATWNVIGDPTLPPEPLFTRTGCVDGRWSHIHENTAQWTSPAAPGLYPRWTIVQTMQDIRSGDIHRTIDLHCVGVAPVVAGPGLTDIGAIDADDDCLSPPTDTNDANPDQDGDMVLDGIEIANGTSLAFADGDFDGSTDFDELFNFTNPNVADTDGDGSVDKLDTTADEVPGTKTVDDDTVLDDNCPTVANPAQLNTDFLPFASAGAHYGDRTQPQQDWLGDVCDRDMDNDHLYNVAEAGIALSPNCTIGLGTTNPLLADHDRVAGSGADEAVDGAECALGGDPTTFAVTFGLCSAVNDPDLDRLCYSPGSPNHLSIETNWRTLAINGFASDLEYPCIAPLGIPSCADALTGTADRDTDGDFLADGLEVKYYATNPSNVDTDSDGCPDGKEVADVSGDGISNPADLGLVAAATMLPAWDANRLARDLNKDGVINAADLGFEATFVSIGGQCPARSGITITRSQQ